MDLYCTVWMVAECAGVGQPFEPTPSKVQFKSSVIGTFFSIYAATTGSTLQATLERGLRTSAKAILQGRQESVRSAPGGARESHKPFEDGRDA